MAAIKTRIVAGACVRQNPEVLEAHLKTLKWQVLPPGVTVDYAFLVDDETSEEIIKEVLPEAIVVPTGGRPEGAVYEVGPITHQWNTTAFDHLAAQKQKILEHARSNHYDYVWFVDSDLLLDQRTLWSLWAAGKDVTSAVFWTEWQKANPMSLGPNVWLRHPYDLTKFKWPVGRIFHELSRRQLIRVAGGGACCLIAVKTLDKIRYFPRLPELPDEGMWRGEDRTLAVLAERGHIQQWADGWPDIFHAYHPDMRKGKVLSAVLEQLGTPRQERAKHGDLVNFSLEALEEGPDFAPVHVRGRLGGIDVLPEIEAALLDLTVGQDAITSLHFPPWYPEINLWDGRPPQQYAGKTKVVRIKVHDIKPYGFQPVIVDAVFRGLMV